MPGYLTEAVNATYAILLSEISSPKPEMPSTVPMYNVASPSIILSHMATVYSR